MSCGQGQKDPRGPARPPGFPVRALPMAPRRGRNPATSRGRGAGGGSLGGGRGGSSAHRTELLSPGRKRKLTGPRTTRRHRARVSEGRGVLGLPRAVRSLCSRTQMGRLRGAGLRGCRAQRSDQPAASVTNPLAPSAIGKECGQVTSCGAAASCSRTQRPRREGQTRSPGAAEARTADGHLQPSGRPGPQPPGPDCHLEKRTWGPWGWAG